MCHVHVVFLLYRGALPDSRPILCIATVPNADMISVAQVLLDRHLDIFPLKNVAIAEAVLFPVRPSVAHADKRCRQPGEGQGAMECCINCGLS
jgi:hypothetical protein